MSIRNVLVGSELPPIRIDPVSRKLLALFAGASGNHRAVHIDIDAAKAKGNADVFVHGMLSMGFLERILTDWVPQEKVRSYRARFVARLNLHAEPTCRGRIVAVKDGLATVDLVIDLDDGTIVIRGEAVVDIT